MIRSRIWSCGHRSCTPEVHSYLIETPRDFIGGKDEGIQLCNFRVGQATTGAEAPFWLRQPWRNLPLFFPPSSLRLQPLPFLTRVWGYHDGKIVELKMFLGKLGKLWKGICKYVSEHFVGLMRLIIFTWKKVNFPAPFPYILSPEDLGDAFRVAGDAFGRPWL